MLRWSAIATSAVARPAATTRAMTQSRRRRRTGFMRTALSSGMGLAGQFGVAARARGFARGPQSCATQLATDLQFGADEIPAQHDDEHGVGGGDVVKVGHAARSGAGDRGPGPASVNSSFMRGALRPG